MEKVGVSQEAGGTPPLPPPPPTLPPNLKPEQLVTPKYSITSRSGVGSTGRKISLLTNHFKVSVNSPDAVFYQYTVCFPLCAFSVYLEFITFQC
jgi:eukaryotic translation initiation factor 2C